MKNAFALFVPLALAAQTLGFSACAKAPTSRKTGPVPTPTSPLGNTRSTADTEGGNTTPPALKLFSVLQVEKASNKLFRCNEYNTPPYSAEQEGALRSPPADQPEAYAFSSSDAACPTADVKATCQLAIPGVQGAYTKIVHGLTADTPAKLAELKQACEAESGQWSETAAAPAPVDPAAGGQQTPQTTPPAGTTGTNTTPPPAAPAPVQKEITAIYRTFLSGVGGFASTLCQIPQGAKITIVGSTTPSTTSIGQVEANMVKTDSCLLERASFVRSEWSGW